MADYRKETEHKCLECESYLISSDYNLQMLDMETLQYIEVERLECHKCYTTFFVYNNEVKTTNYRRSIFSFYSNGNAPPTLQVRKEQREQMSFSCFVSGEEINPTERNFMDIGWLISSEDNNKVLLVKRRYIGLVCRDCGVHNLENNNIEIGEIYNTEGNVINICVNCSRDRKFFGYNFRKLKGRSKKHNPFSRHVGIEIETVYGDSFGYLNMPESLRSLVGCHYDGSLRESNICEEDEENDDYDDCEGDVGREFVVVPLAQDKLFTTTEELCNFLSEQNCRINRSCGLHIHFDMKNETIETMRKTFLLYSIVEESLFDMLPHSRRNNRYCIPLKKHYRNFFGNSFDRYWYESDNRFDIEHQKRQKYNETRYASINYHALFFHGTLENRMHSGTINPNKIKNWILLNHMIIEYAKKTPMEKLLKMRGGNKLLFSIVAYYEKKYPILRKYKIPEYVMQRQEKFANRNVEKPIKIINEIKPTEYDNVKGIVGLRTVFNE